MCPNKPKDGPFGSRKMSIVKVKELATWVAYSNVLEKFAHGKRKSSKEYSGFS